MEQQISAANVCTKVNRVKLKVSYRPHWRVVANTTTAPFFLGSASCFLLIASQKVIPF